MKYPRYKGSCASCKCSCNHQQLKIRTPKIPSNFPLQQVPCRSSTNNRLCNTCYIRLYKRYAFSSPTVSSSASVLLSLSSASSGFTTISQQPTASFLREYRSSSSLDQATTTDHILSNDIQSMAPTPDQTMDQSRCMEEQSANLKQNKHNKKAKKNKRMRRRTGT